MNLYRKRNFDLPYTKKKTAVKSKQVKAFANNNNKHNKYIMQIYFVSCVGIGKEGV